MAKKKTAQPAKKTTKTSKKATPTVGAAADPQRAAKVIEYYEDQIDKLSQVVANLAGSLLSLDPDTEEADLKAFNESLTKMGINLQLQAPKKTGRKAGKKASKQIAKKASKKPAKRSAK